MKQFITHTLNAHKRKIIAVICLIVLTIGGYVAYFRYFGALPQSTAYLFQEIRLPNSADTIIVFSPHQDDESLGAGGYVADAIAKGAQVYIVFATDGNHRHLETTRQQEAYRATSILGVLHDHIIFYNYPDTELKQHMSALNQSVLQTLSNLKPTEVFVTDPVDIHPDHAALGTSVFAMVKQSHLSIEEYSFVIHYPRYPRPQQFRPHLFLLPPVRLLEANRQWLQFTLSGTDFDKKNEAVLQYHSQLRTPFLHSLMLSFVRQNELFSKETP